MSEGSFLLRYYLFIPLQNIVVLDESAKSTLK